MKTVYKNGRTTTTINTAHYIKVRNERERLGLPVKRQSDRIDHPLIGKKVKTSEKEYTVDYACKQWYWGYYITLFLVDDAGSHAVRYWENISCINETVLESIEENQKNFLTI